MYTGVGGEQNMDGMTACASTKGQRDDLKKFTEIKQMESGVRVKYEN